MRSSGRFSSCGLGPPLNAGVMRNRVSSLACLVVVGLSVPGCSRTSVEVGTMKFQTLVEEVVVYDALLEIAPRVGYTLKQDMRKRKPDNGIPFAGLHFEKDQGRVWLAFSPTTGSACYRLAIHTFDEEQVQRSSQDVTLLEKELKARFGAQLIYSGHNACPPVTHN